MGSVAVVRQPVSPTVRWSDRDGLFFIDIYATHVNYMCKYVPRITICLNAQKTLNAVKAACHSIFGLTLTEEI